MPRYEDLDWEGLNVTREDYEKLTNIDAAAWREEVKDHGRLFEQLKSRMPAELANKRNELEHAIS
jgi:phosphoenolpyruvate carboxykinase (GTP)